MPEEQKKYVVQIPGKEHVAYWNEEKYTSNRDKLFEQYPDAQVTEYSMVDPKTVVNDDGQYAVTIPGKEHVAQWDGKKFAANREKLYQQYPNAQVHRINDVTAQRNRDFAHQYEFAQDKVNDETLPADQKQQYVDYVNSKADRYEAVREKYGRENEAPVPEAPEVKPLAAIWQGLKKSTIAMGGHLMNLFAESSRSLGRASGAPLADDRLANEAYAEFQRRQDAGEELFQEPLSKEELKKLSKEERSAAENRQRINGVLNRLRDDAIRNGLDPNLTVARQLADASGVKDVQVIQDAADKIVDKYGTPLEGWERVGGILPMVATSAASVALAASGNAPAAYALGEATMSAFAASSAGSAMKQARDAGASDAQVGAAGIASAAIMYLFGKIPVGRYIDKVVSASAANAVAKAAAGDVEKELQALMADLAKRGVIVSKESVGTLAKEFAKRWGGHIATSAASFAAMGAAEAAVPLIYADPEQYPLLNNMLQAAKDGAIDGLIMGTLAGGFSTGSEFTARARVWKNQGYVQAAEMGFKPGDMIRRYDPKTGQWEQINVTKESNQFGEIVGFNGENDGPIYVRLEDGGLYEILPDNVRITKKIAFADAKKAAERAFEEQGYEEGKNATQEQRSQQQLDYKTAEKRAERDVEAGDPVPESTRLEVKRAESAMQGRKDAVRSEIESRVGRPFWRTQEVDIPVPEGESPMTSQEDMVSVITYKDRGEVYITGEDENGYITVDSEGKVGFVSKADVQTAVQNGEATQGTWSLDIYLDSKVREMDGMAEQERMAKDQAGNLAAIQQKVQEEGRVNVGTPENEVWGKVIDVDPTPGGGVAVIVEGEKDPRALTWAEVASKMAMPLEAKTDNDIVDERLNTDAVVEKYNQTIQPGAELQVPMEGAEQPATYKFGRAEVVDGDIIIKATDPVSGKVVDLAPEMVSNLDTLTNPPVLQQDVDGRPLPPAQPASAPVEVFNDPVANELGISKDFAYTNTKGEVVVDGGKLWAADPKLWAQWNDRNPGRVIPTKNYLDAKLKEIDAEVGKAKTALDAEAVGEQRPDVMEQLRDDLNQKMARQQTISGLLDEYKAAENAAAVAEKAVEQVKENSAPVNTMDTDKTPVGKGNGTATPQNAVPDNKGSEISVLERHKPIINTAQEKIGVIDQMLQGVSDEGTRSLVMNEKARALQQMFDEMGEGNTTVATMDNIAQLYGADGAPAVHVKYLQTVMDQLKRDHQRLRAFKGNGRVYVIADGVYSAEDAVLADVHENKHLENVRTGAHIKALETGITVKEMLSALSSKEMAGNDFYEKQFIKGYLDEAGLADEVIAHSSEIAEQFGVDAVPEILRKNGVSNEEFINFVKTNIEDGRRTRSEHLRPSRRLAHEPNGSEINGGQDVGSVRPESGILEGPRHNGTDGGSRQAVGGGAPEVRVDNQGNPVDASGKLIVVPVSSINDIQDSDFTNPTRNVVLPVIAKNLSEALGITGKPVIIKKNIFEKNRNGHPELSPDASRDVLNRALYSPTHYANIKPISRPDYRVAIQTGDKNSVVVLDIYEHKDNVEVVGWRAIDEEGLEQMEKQTRKEGGQFLILSPEDGSAADLSALQTDLLSENKDSNLSEESKVFPEKEQEQVIKDGVSSISDAVIVDESKPVLSIKTEEDVERKIREFAKSKEGQKLGWTDAKINQIISETSDLIRAIHAAVSGDKYYDEWAKKDPTVKVDWRDGVEKPTVTWARANIEYKYDMSADLLCINNEGLETVLASPKMVDLMLKMNETTEEGFTSEDYLRLYETLSDMGFVVPCKGCFDAAMRFKMLPSVSRKFVELVNKTIDERNQDPNAFDDALREQAGVVSTIDGFPVSAKNKEDAVRIGVAGDNLTEHISWPQLMSAEGQTQALSDWGGIFRAWQRTGAGRPKDKLLPEPWTGDIVSTTTTIIGKYGEKTPSYRDILVNQGTGLRRNSHSEFRPICAIDEIQFMREAFIRGLTVFKYMKELDDVRLFGKMGVKFNLSFFPAFVKGAPAAGLDANGDYIAAEESVGGHEYEYKDENEKTHYDGMRGWEEAQKYVNKDVSLSSVIFSIPHLIKAFTDVPTPSDPHGRWGSLIPFHATGATREQLRRQGLGDARALGLGHPFEEAYTDYDKGVTNFEDVQNDRFGEGWEILEGKKAGTAVEPGHKLEFANGTHYYNKALGLHLYPSFYVYDSELRRGDYDSKGNVIASKAKERGHEFGIDYNDTVRAMDRAGWSDAPYKAATDYFLRKLPELGLVPRFDFTVPEDVFLKMCAAANTDPNHPKLGWRGTGNGWSPVDSDACYALWCDYGMTDPETGRYSPHVPVGVIDENGDRVFRMPENTIEIIKAGIARYTTRKERENSRVDEAIEEFAKRSIEEGKLTQEDVDAVNAEYAQPELTDAQKMALAFINGEDYKAAAGDFRASVVGVENLEKDGVVVNDEKMLKEYGLSDLTMTKKGNLVTINKIVAAKKGQGAGTKFMNDIVAEADRKGWTLALTPDSSFGASSVNRLKEFYKRFGFKENKGRNIDFTINESMVRTPGSKGKANPAQESAELPEDTRKLFDAAKKRFGVTKDLNEAGYILPDGTLLDFSGRHMDSAFPESHKGLRQVDHRDIADLNYEEDLNTPSGFHTRMSDFINRGAIRMHMGSRDGSINLANIPTPEQESVIRRIIDRYNGDVTVDFGDGENTSHYAYYQAARPARVMNDISRYFNEGERPEGNMRFSVREERDRDYMRAVESNDMVAAESLVRDAAAHAMPETVVVGKDGKPKVVYHGTNTYGFNAFAKPGEDLQGLIWTTDDKRYAEYYSDPNYSDEAGTYNLFVDIKNPLNIGYVEDVVGSEAWNNIAAQLNLTPEELYKRLSPTSYEQAIKQADYIYDYTRTAEFANLLKEYGYDGVIALEDGVNKIPTYGAVSPEQVKSADAITRDDSGNVVPLSERFNTAKEDIRFSVDNVNQDIFVSNAEKAVKDIKMEKATPEQWLKMLESNGGLKAGEDKWLGLSDWLKASTAKTISKEDVQKYIAENKIQIEEVRYSQNARFRGEPMFADRYDNTEGEDVRPADGLRLGYTTPGLTRNREIALTVPTIEPWNQSDKTHFGDAGEGRAVAWVRFGDTWVSKEKDAAHQAYLEADEAFRSYREELIAKYALQATGTKTTRDLATPEENARLRELMLASLEKKNEWNSPNHKRENVLVIDEIQSKRHQDGREFGYSNKDAYKSATVGEFRKFTVDDEQFEEAEVIGKNGRRLGKITKNEDGLFYAENADGTKVTSSRRTVEEALEAMDKAFTVDGIPEAPFEKNWHELAMKRMLRLAAEEGYDYIAWTTGEQQAERYSLEQSVSEIAVKVVDNNKYRVVIEDKDGMELRDYSGSGKLVTDKELAELVGKDLAVKLIAGAEESRGKQWNGRGKNPEYYTVKGDDLKVGGNGMKGFYDDMLVRYVNKYGKKWGVKVEDLFLPNVGGADADAGLATGLTMHSIPVTEEMKASVMEGQPMFSVKGEQKTESGEVIKYQSEGGLPQQEGRTSYVERTYSKRGDFSFTGKDKIESVGDVAYIFKQLETSAVENSFIVYVRGGRPTILHTGIGDIAQVGIDQSAFVAGMNDFAPDEIYMVHNHPSGNVTASKADMAIIEALQRQAGNIPVKGIIIDTISGKYGEFDRNTFKNVSKSEESNEGDIPIEVKAFDKMVFSPEYVENLNEKPVRNAEEVAAFLSAHRLGEGQKLGALLLDHAQNVVGSLVLNENVVSGANAGDIADEIVNAAVHTAASNAVLFGDFAYNGRSLLSLRSSIQLGSGNKITLQDIVRVEGNYTLSADKGNLPSSVREEDVLADIANRKATGEDIRFSIREKEEPKKTIKVYKLMRLGDNKESVGPLFIDRAASPMELGKYWYDAESPSLDVLETLEPGYAYKIDADGKVVDKKEVNRTAKGSITRLPNKDAVNQAAEEGARWMTVTLDKKGNRSYHNVGINGAESTGTYALRPGWHAGSLPTMRQIGKGPDKNIRDDNFVWVEGEMPADVDYQPEADANPGKDIPTHIPTDGYYMKATNADKVKSQADRVGWYVAGSFKPNRIISDAEARSIIDAWNMRHPNAPVEYDWEREGGRMFNAETMALEEPAPKKDGRMQVYHGSGAAFNQFDNSHEFEGEGAMVHGYGHYFALNPEKASDYAWNDAFNRAEEAGLVDPDIAYIVSNDSFDSYDEMVARYDYLLAKKKEALEKELEETKADSPNGEGPLVDDLTADLNVLNGYRPLEEVLRDQRNVYTVTIPENTGENYIDEMKTLYKDGRRRIADVVRNLPDELLMRTMHGPNWLPEGFKTLANIIERNQYAALEIRERLVDALGTEKAASEVMHNAGFAGITYEGRVDGPCVVVFSDDDIQVDGHVRFSVTNENNAIFISNAEKAVDEIQMGKATPEQWLKMLESKGGLKAGEDKWIGLSDWLKSQDKKTLTKQEVQDYIAQNRIQIEEQDYSEDVNMEEVIAQEYQDRIAHGKTIEQLQAEVDELAESPQRYDAIGDNDEELDSYLMEQMKDAYGDDFEMGYSIIDGAVDFNIDPYAMDEYDFNDTTIGTRKINSTRLSYTTEGLTNKKEIALTVPTIEPWNTGDPVHFGDAGEGRAVAWIRFGDTDIDAGGKAAAQDAYRQAEEAYKAYKSSLRQKYGNGILDYYEKATDAERAQLNQLKKESERLYREYAYGSFDKKRILFIDEIQSKRHQEGREKGYRDKVAVAVPGIHREGEYTPNKYMQGLPVAPLLDDNGAKIGQIERYTFGGSEEVSYKAEQFEPFMSTGYASTEDEAIAKLSQLRTADAKGVPTAPFEKNWHELAMKRMLRYAAENGYDMVAWTTGDQQAERYDLGNRVSHIDVYPDKAGNERIVNIHLIHEYDDYINVVLDKDGNILHGGFNGDTYDNKNISDLVGKDLAVKIMSATEKTELSGNDFRIGAEGMQGFYDDILPRFMNKYGKKWGVKVEDIELPVGDAGALTAHSVPVTAEMKASVLEGQPMFSVQEEEYRRNEEIAAVEKGGLGAVIGEDKVAPLYKGIYAALPKNVLKPIVDKAMGSDLNIRKQLDAYLHNLAKAGTTEDETGLLRNLYDQIRNLAGDPMLSDNDVRYMIWKSTDDSTPGDLLSLAEQQAVKHQWHVGEEYPAFSAADDFHDTMDEARKELEADVKAADKERNKEMNAAAAAAQESSESFKDELEAINKAMKIQKNYDKATVDGIVKFAKKVLKEGNVDALTLREANRLLTLVAGSNGKSPAYATRYSDQLLDEVLKHVVKAEKAKFQKLVNVKDKTVAQSGVEKLGRLDVQGQTTIKAFRDYMNRPARELEERLIEISDLMNSRDAAVRKQAFAEYEGLILARDYQNTLFQNIAEIADLEEELELGESAKDTGNIDRKTYNEYMRAAKMALRESRMEIVDTYRDFSKRLAEMISGSTTRAKAFREAEKERVENIHHDANRDMQGVPTNEHRRDSVTERVLNSDIMRFFLKPLATFDQMLRLLGRKNITGEGYLWNRYMRQWEASAEKSYAGFFEATEALDKKVAEVFDKEGMIWSDLYAVERDMPKMEVTFMDGGEMRKHELTQGNLLYIYMVDKMIDGKMKLRKMGISEEDVEAIKKQLDPRFIELADWLQDDYLVERRNKYNEVHERMFGAPMAAIENYFPIKILANARIEEVDLGSKPNPSDLSSTVTGSIIKRRKNSLALDVMHTDAFSLVIEHIQQMEDWAAFAEFRKDLNTLLSYKRFRNQVQNMNTIYGSGKVLWENFKDVAALASGSYRPKVGRQDIDAVTLNVAKGVTAAKIAFRVNTAIKQLLSFPAYLPDVNIGDLAKSMATPGASWNWCMKNLPIFQQRWKSRIAGDTRLMDTDSDWRIWRNEVVKKASQWGMMPNAFVDATTVAVGTKAMYDTRYRRYIEAGYSEKQADRKAKQDATILYNQTQQSSENAFVSAMQKDRTFLSVMLTVFRNSPMSYQRQLHDALRTFGRLMQADYRSERIEFMKNQQMNEGVDEESAQDFAEKEYNRQWWRSAVRVAVFGFILQLAWNLGSNMWYMVFGKNKKVKKKMLKDAATKAIAGPVEGFAGGGIMSDAWGTISSGGKVGDIKLGELPAVSDLNTIIREWNSDKPAAYYDIVNLVVQSGFGVNPETVSDAVAAIVDACNGDLGLAKEVGLLMMRIAQVPQSTLDQLYIDELEMSAKKAKRLSPKQLAERYVDYKLNRGAGPFRGAYSDEDEAKRRKSIEKNFNKKVKERKELNKK